ncbi:MULTISPECIES: hypothetical protein [unclassified Chelatococcus]|uniref:hypothetical protein n=1 Tax=unclassified Chelatococcus TaxID=2638111 RepID=UPI00030C6228|nr:MULTISPECIES: hypothetical protein [unclassified Chelatococcus]ALA18288.1 hypothetical protein AL346_13805 [Chelatococcus sp. CO-6]
MTFLLRSALVIGVIFFLSPVREGADDGRSAAAPGSELPSPAIAEALTGEVAKSADAAQRALALWQMLDDDTRRRLVEALTGQSATKAPPAAGSDSRDTLNEGDRGVPWRGPAAGRG